MVPNTMGIRTKPRDAHISFQSLKVSLSGLRVEDWEGCPEYRNHMPQEGVILLRPPEARALIFL